MKVYKIALSVLLLASCTHKINKEETSEFSDRLENDGFDYAGTYSWSFNLMGSEQISTHRLYQDSISYSMTGKVYSTDYTMKKLSYEKKKGKWIGVDKDGVVYVLFFKEKMDSTFTLYKRKCKNNGLEEAINFDVPAPDATDDHGWNVYTLGKMDAEDVLGFNGDFVGAEHKVSLTDSLIVFDNTPFQKLSYHSGERRWVGKHETRYLQVFFKDFKDNDDTTVFLSIEEHPELETIYQIKFNEVSFAEYEQRKE